MSKKPGNKRIRLTVMWIALCLAFPVARKSQGFDQDPGHQTYLVVKGVRFSCPKGFDCAKNKIADETVYVPHHKYDLGLVVSVPSVINEESLQAIARGATAQLFPKELGPFSWKRIPDDTSAISGKKGSRFEGSHGIVQGFNGKQRVLFQFRTIKYNDKETVVAYIFGMGRGEQGRVEFEQDLWGDSMPGWYAQAHVMASITGEKYTDINPGTEIIATPPEEIRSSSARRNQRSNAFRSHFAKFAPAS